MEFAYAGGGLGKGGEVTLFTDGKKVGQGPIEATLANVFSADDGCDVGEDTGAPVSPDSAAWQAERQVGDVVDRRSEPASRPSRRSGNGNPRCDGAAVSTLRLAAPARGLPASLEIAR